MHFLQLLFEPLKNRQTLLSVEVDEARGHDEGVLDLL
jgi:hypothetical protein